MRTASSGHRQHPPTGLLISSYAYHAMRFQQRFGFSAARGGARVGFFGMAPGMRPGTALWLM